MFGIMVNIVTDHLWLVTSLGLEKKAKLLEIGEIHIPKEVNMPCFASRSTAGPDAGASSYAFLVEGKRVKLGATKDPDARLRLAQNNGHFNIFLDTDKFAENVKVLPLLAHAPNQTFMNLSSDCMMNCAFCTTPELIRGNGSEMTPERVMKIIRINSRHPSFEAVALTSGIPDSIRESNQRMTSMIKAVRAEFPKVPIGVEAYFENPKCIQYMKDAGADEIKINIETWPPELFKKVCPNRDREKTLAALEEAVRIFGRNKVQSNYIIGLGETDEEVIEGLKQLSQMGVVTNLRGIRFGDLNRSRLEKVLGRLPEKVSAERLIKLAKVQKNILEMNHLTTETFKTMCFSCECCDIMPFRNF